MAITTSISSPADLANNALVRLGFKLRVGSLLDGSDHAAHILDVYSQTRDEMLRQFDYDFASRTLTLTLLKSAPTGGYFPPNLWNPATMPPVGSLYEYAWPSDAIKIRSLKYTPMFVLNYDPQPTKFTEYNDNNYTPAQRTIVTNVPNAIAIYTGRVTDPTTWDVAFSDAFAARLATVIGPALVGLEGTKMAMSVSPAERAISEAEQR